MVQVGSNPLSSASIGPELRPGTKDLTKVEPSCSHRNKHQPVLVLLEANKDIKIKKKNIKFKI